jgi:long-subunit acyl-CoA synthetase (AMP-forming)
MLPALALAGRSDASFYLLILSRQLKGFELIRAVHLDPVPFDMERDLITPTYKKKRPQLLKHYQVHVLCRQ